MVSWMRLHQPRKPRQRLCISFRERDDAVSLKARRFYDYPSIDTAQYVERCHFKGTVIT